MKRTIHFPVDFLDIKRYRYFEVVKRCLRVEGDDCFQQTR